MSTIKIEIEEGDQDHFWLMMEMFAANSRFWIEASHSTQAERELGRIRINAVLRFMRAARKAKRDYEALQGLEEAQAAFDCPEGCGPLNFSDGEMGTCPQCGNEWSYAALSSAEQQGEQR